MSKEFFKRILSSVVLLPVASFFLLSGPFFSILFIIICFIIAFYEWNKMNKNIFYKIFGSIFLLFSFYSFYELSSDLFLLIFVILVCISTDIGGYFFGKIFKGPKITKISPNKTYAGMIGGYILSLIFFFIIVKLINYQGTLIQLFILKGI